MKNDYSYSLKIEGKLSFLLYTIIKKILIHCFYEYDTNTLFFTAEKIQTLSQYISVNSMSYNKCVKMMDNLTIQMNYLKSKNYGFYGFSMEDILVVDDDIFLFINTTYLMPLYDNYFMFISPIFFPEFTSSEIMNIKKLPAKLHYNTCYYSFALFIMNCMKRNNQSNDEVLEHLKNTKLYWFLKRCIEPISYNRQLLFI